MLRPRRQGADPKQRRALATGRRLLPSLLAALGTAAAAHALGSWSLAFVGPSRVPNRLERWRTAVAQADRADGYQHLTPREHVLKRPDMYIGPLQLREEVNWVVHQGSDGAEPSMKETTLTISPAFVQIFNEILVNAADRQFNDQYGDGMSEIRVDVDVEVGEITVWCDGGPIPVEQKSDTGLWVPTMVFGHFMSGDNFDDSKTRYIGGRNGIGAKATNAFSKLFEIEVIDPDSGKRFLQTWEDNMAVANEPIITPVPADAPKNGGVKVRFRPDLKRFGLRSIDKSHMRLLHARVFDTAACVRSDIDVYFNGELVPAQSFGGYARLVLGDEVATATIVDDRGRPRMEVAASYAEDDGFSAIGLVNAIRCSQGTHIDQVAKQLGEGILDLLPGKSSLRRAANLKAGSVKKYLRLVVKVLVDNPNFDSQTKTRLSTVKAKMGFDFELPEVFVKEVGDLGVFDAVLGDTRKKEDKAVQEAMNKESNRAPLHPKLEDARFAGKDGKNCTLIITEGDSAKALAVAGLAKWGRESYGIFPLKGKLMNVRSATSKMLQNNDEIKYLTQIIGLEWGRKYKSDDELRSSLRYQHLMIFADQDLDGDHIAGLLLNYVSAGWPSLLQIRPNFFLRFATPIVKVFDKKTKAGAGEQEMFLTEGDFVRWQEQNPDWGRKYRAKYYKGLGTSNRDEAIQYFSNPDKHVISFVREDSQDDRSVALAFSPGQEDNRKKWIEDGFEAPELDYTRSSATFTEFINNQLVKFSAYNCERALPLLLDGLKPSQRKVIYVARRVKGGEMRVSQMAGRVIEEAAYHHGEVSLEGAIVHLAQNFVGANNANLLEPSGMFGSRLAGRDEHAASRYLHTQTSNLAKYVFRQEDDGILDSNVVDGKQVEPAFFLPVVPIVLLNGFKGIGTGWACNGPNYGALEVADALQKHINGEPVPRLLPAYRGFRGRIVEMTNSNGDVRVYSEGVWKVHAAVGRRVDTIEITELPIGVWTDDFVEKVQDKAEQTGVMAEVYKCRDHDDQNVHLLICLSPDELAAGRYGRITKGTNVTQLFGRFFNLRRPLSSTNYLFHRRVNGQKTETRVQHFADANAILEEFYEVRRGFYAKRKEHQIAVLSREVERKSNQVRFIRTFDHAKLRTAGAGAEALLEKAGFQRLSAEPATESSEEDDDSKDSKASFSYLLRMNFRSLTSQKAGALEADLNQKNERLKVLKETTVERMWLNDIDDFRSAYTKEVGKQPPLSAVKQTELMKATNTFKAERSRARRGVDKEIKVKGPASAHNVFFKDNFAAVFEDTSAEEDYTKRFSKTAKALAKKYNELDKKQKAAYDKLAKKDKERYKLEKERAKRMGAPQLPKKPPTARNLWMKQHFDRIAEEIGSRRIADVSKAASPEWKAVRKAEKMELDKEVNRLKKEYNAELKVHKASLAAWKKRMREEDREAKAEAKRLRKLAPPQNAYMLYGKENRDKIRQDLGPSAVTTEVMKEQGARWKSLSDSERAVYQQRLDQMRKEFEMTKSR